jgi:dihydropteroate synthase
MIKRSYDFSFKGKLNSLDFPCVMGILNVTDDSFYSDSRMHNEKKLIETAIKMHKDGAFILDIGAVSTRPGANLPNEKEESSKLLPALKSVRKHLPDILISVDTFRSEIARMATNEGADIINDISGGTMDTNMFRTVAEIRLPYILMHIQGTPQNMQKNPTYDILLNDINYFFAQQIQKARNAGINDLIIDPGFGFGKTTKHNFELLGKLGLLKIHSLPILAGLSRKSMIYRTLKSTPKEALNGTVVLNTVAILKGADILRVHDVKEGSEIIRLIEQMNLQ